MIAKEEMRQKPYTRLRTSRAIMLCRKELVNTFVGKEMHLFSRTSYGQAMKETRKILVEATLKVIDEIHPITEETEASHFGHIYYRASRRSTSRCLVKYS